MDQNVFSAIEQKISYQFKNKNILQQAFIRRSYSQENPQWQNNEVLELIGDSELNAYVVRKLIKEFGSVSAQFFCKKNEGELSELKARNVDKHALSHCMDLLGFHKYLIMGNSDVKNNVSDSASVKEDLFEAIVGAVAIDSDFNRTAIDKVCEQMLCYADFEDNYIQLVSEWCSDNNYRQPLYYVNMRIGGSFYSKITLWGPSFYQRIYECEGEGKTAELAKMAAAENLYYDYCDVMDMRSVIGDSLNEEMAVTQLHELYQKGFFEEPEYSFFEKHDSNGRPFWTCDCCISDYVDVKTSSANSKKDAKKQAAYLMLRDVLNLDSDMDGEVDDEWGGD